mmetsp:Transcript_94332/g.270184  ORF Transcript_94332/g.270184 Transcript_94332/m.270184 type:complete len:339 (-) Transcript_94332:512-1528(-)
MARGRSRSNSCMPTTPSYAAGLPGLPSSPCPRRTTAAGSSHGTGSLAVTYGVPRTSDGRSCPLRRRRYSAPKSRSSTCTATSFRLACRRKRTGPRRRPRWSRRRSRAFGTSSSSLSPKPARTTSTARRRSTAVTLSSPKRAARVGSASQTPPQRFNTYPRASTMATGRRKTVEAAIPRGQRAALRGTEGPWESGEKGHFWNLVDCRVLTSAQTPAAPPLGLRPPTLFARARGRRRATSACHKPPKAAAKASRRSCASAPLGNVIAYAITMSPNPPRPLRGMPSPLSRCTSPHATTERRRTSTCRPSRCPTVVLNPVSASTSGMRIVRCRSSPSRVKNS